MELTTRSASLAFVVSGIYICACARIPCVLRPRGIQVVLHCRRFPQVSESQVQELCSEVVSPPLSLPCPSPVPPLSFHCFISVTGACFLSSACGFMAGLQGLASHGSSLQLAANSGSFWMPQAPNRHFARQLLNVL